ncbi:hypothetical protein DAX_218 [Vibrio phage Dax]|nr:hypothetical protein DAX_218 [Vibrio phage Dax]
MRMITVLNKGGGNETCSHLRWGLHPLSRPKSQLVFPNFCPNPPKSLNPVCFAPRPPYNPIYLLKTPYIVFAPRFRTYPNPGHALLHAAGLGQFLEQSDSHLQAPDQIAENIKLKMHRIGT